MQSIVTGSETSAPGISRRDFLLAGGAGCAALGLAQAASAEPSGPGISPNVRSVILLWMDGGPSQHETFDPKNGDREGLFGSIRTNVDGLRVSGLMPHMARRMDRVCIHRALHHSEGAHEAATRQVLAGWPAGEPVFPALAGSQFVPDSPAPHLAAGSIPALASLGTPIRAAWSSTRVSQRHVLASGLAGRSGKAAHLAVRAELAHSVSAAGASERYGDSAFGRHCLAARKLVESGAGFVSVTLGGWDAHADLAGAYRELVPALDQAFAALLTDLEDRGLLESTRVVWMGEFGRGPVVNALGGRDHWPYAGCAVLAGAGITGGQVVGDIDDAGMSLLIRQTGME